MTRRETLFQNYENAYFALLLDEVAIEEGTQLIEKNRLLKEAPHASVSNVIVERCLKAIRRAFSKNQRRDTAKTILSVLNKAAMAAVIALVLFTSAYAAFPDVRIKTLNLLIEISDVSASLTLVEEGEGSQAPNNRAIETDDKLLMGYRIPEMPEGFELIDEGSDNKSAWLEYGNDKGASIYMCVSGNANITYTVDVEDAEYIENVEINHFEGLLIVKDGRTHIAWADTAQEKYIEILTQGVDRTLAVKCASALYFVGN